MEFCCGGTLQNKLEKSNPSDLPLSLIWQWSFEIIRGLCYLHENGVLHRDLKSENILLDKNNTAKLADLGVAQVDSLLEDKEAKVVEIGLQDQRFISPENLENPTLSSQFTDIFAIGLIFWQMMSGGKIPRHPNEMTTQEKEFWKKELLITREKSFPTIVQMNLKNLSKIVGRQIQMKDQMPKRYRH